MALVEPPILQHERLGTVNEYVYYGPPSFSTISYAMDLKARLLHFTNHQQSSDDVARIYWGLRNISVVATTAFQTDSLSDICFSDRCEVLERAVQELLHRSLRESSRKSDNRDLIFALFARACLIYIYSALRELLTNVKIFQEIGNRMGVGLDIGDHDLNDLLSAFPDLMLWVLCLGRGVVLSSKVSFAEMTTRILKAKETEDRMTKDLATAFLWPEGRKNYDGSTFGDVGSDDVSSPEPWVVDVSLS
jgi:hypothetical protein